MAWHSFLPVDEAKVLVVEKRYDHIQVQALAPFLNYADAPMLVYVQGRIYWPDYAEDGPVLTV